MSLRSISRRVYLAMLAVSALSMVAMVMTVLIVNEDLEQTMLEVDFTQQRDFILGNNTGEDVLIWESPNLNVVFIPTGKPRPTTLPDIFRGLADPYSGEIELAGETYLVDVGTVKGGVLYVGKNITHFENREALFQSILIGMAAVIIVFSLVLARVSSRRIVRPLTRLSERISRTPVGPSMPRMQTDYIDTELHAIATTFNRFLQELESYVKREQSLLNMASHELRTPIAVMSGALDIIELRDQLSPNDRVTLKRVREACDEMRDNVNVLLQLARRETDHDIREPIDVRCIIQHVIDDLTISHQTGGRISLTATHPFIVNANGIMLHLLLRNLIQNAAQHTRNAIHVTFAGTLIEIEDQGSGLSPTQKRILLRKAGEPQDETPLGGLGLYIVTLITERLGWTIDIKEREAGGTRITVDTSLAHL